MANEHHKLKMVAALVGILTGSQALSAKQADVLTKVYAQIPQVSDISDKQEIGRFIDSNFGRLNPETIKSLRALISPEDKNAKAKGADGSYDVAGCRLTMCMVD